MSLRKRLAAEPKGAEGLKEAPDTGDPWAPGDWGVARGLPWVLRAGTVRIRDIAACFCFWSWSPVCRMPGRRLGDACLLPELGWSAHLFGASSHEAAAAELQARSGSVPPSLLRAHVLNMTCQRSTDSMGSTFGQRMYNIACTGLVCYSR